MPILEEVRFAAECDRCDAELTEWAETITEVFVKVSRDGGQINTTDGSVLCYECLHQEPNVKVPAVMLVSKLSVPQ